MSIHTCTTFTNGNCTVCGAARTDTALAREQATLDGRILKTLQGIESTLREIAGLLPLILFFQIASAVLLFFIFRMSR